MKFPPLPPGNLHHGNRGKEERYQRVVNKKIEKKEKKERRKNGEGLNMDVSVFHGAREHDRICSSKYLHAWITITAEWKQCTRQWGGEGVEKVDLLIPTCAVWRRVGSEKKKKKEKSGERIQVFQVTSGLRGGWWRCYFALLAGGGMVEGRFEDEIRDAWNKNSFFFFFTCDWRSERARVIGDCFIPVDTRGRVGECIVLGCFWSHGWK